MFKKATATGLLLIGFGSDVLAAPPACVDRPTPPPCCADGYCYPNPLTFGVYPTRWRRWPVEHLEPSRAGEYGPSGQPLGDDIPNFELPEAKDEDLRAPPPTAPREEPLRTAPQDSPPGPNSGAPPTPNTPQPLQLAPPTESREPGAIRRTLEPYEPKTPAPNTLNLNDTGPTGDFDPPPALPFGPRLTGEATPLRGVQKMPGMPVRQPAPTRSAAPSDDPPPSLPGVLANWSH
jgi:hypothetical protein